MPFNCLLMLRSCWWLRWRAAKVAACANCWCACRCGEAMFVRGCGGGEQAGVTMHSALWLLKRLSGSHHT